MNDPSILLWFAIAFAALYLLPFVLGPVLLRITLTQQANPEVVPWESSACDRGYAVRSGARPTRSRQ